ncbi:MAG: alpha/beta hydrolase [Planctomycetales bacterium]
MNRTVAASMIVLGCAQGIIAPTSASAQEEVKVEPDVVYGHKFGLAMTLDAFHPPGIANGAGVMFMVSGGWHSRWFPPERGKAMFKPLLDEGFTVFAVRHGSSPKFKIPEVVADVRRAARFLRLNAERFKIDPARLGVFGGSAGGHLSLMLATTGDDGDPKSKDPILRASSRVAAAVALYPPTDVRPWVNEDSPYWKNYPALQFDPQKSGDYSPLLHVTQDDAPSLIIHGDQDKLVPLDHGEKIHKAFQEKKVASELLVIQGAAHGFRGEDKKRSDAALVAWFKKHLAPK